MSLNGPEYEHQNLRECTINDLFVRFLGPLVSVEELTLDERSTRPSDKFQAVGFGHLANVELTVTDSLIKGVKYINRHLSRCPPC